MPHTSTVLPAQAEVLACEERMAAVCGGWRAGKSRMFADWLHDRMERYPQARHYVVGGDLPQLKRGFLLTFRALMDEYKIAYEYLSTDGTIRLKHNGAKIEPLSAEIRSRILSAEADTLLLEEPQTWEGEAETYQTVMSRLSGSPQALAAYGPHVCAPMMRMSFNPVPVGHWIYDLLVKRRAMRWWRFSVRDNFLWPGREDYLKLQESILPPELWRVHLDGHWSTTGGAVYRNYDQSIHGVVPNGLPAMGLRDAPLQWGLDFNVGFQCSVVAQAYVQPAVAANAKSIAADWQRKVLYVIDELAIPDAGAEDVVKEFLRRYGDHAKKYGLTVYGDASGGARSQVISAQSAVRTNWQAIRKALMDYGIPLTWKVPAVNPSVGDRINEVNAQMRSGDGFGLLVDVDRCSVLVHDFLAVQYKPGTNDIEKKNSPPELARLTHMSDGLGYLVAMERMRSAEAGIAFGRTTR